MWIVPTDACYTETEMALLTITYTQRKEDKKESNIACFLTFSQSGFQYVCDKKSQEGLLRGQEGAESGANRRVIEGKCEQKMVISTYGNVIMKPIV